MTSQLENELSCIKHYQVSMIKIVLVNSVRVDGWTAELAIIATANINIFYRYLCNRKFISFLSSQSAKIPHQILFMKSI